MKNNLGPSVVPSPAATEATESIQQKKTTETTEAELLIDQQPITPQRSPVTVNNCIPPATEQPSLIVNEQLQRPIRERRMPSRFKDYIMG